MPNEPWPALVDLTFSEAAELIAQWGVHAAVSDRQLSDRGLSDRELSLSESLGGICCKFRTFGKNLLRVIAR